jgi:hypothetical protein
MTGVVDACPEPSAGCGTDRGCVPRELKQCTVHQRRVWGLGDQLANEGAGPEAETNQYGTGAVHSAKYIRRPALSCARGHWERNVGRLGWNHLAASETNRQMPAWSGRRLHAEVGRPQDWPRSITQ